MRPVKPVRLVPWSTVLAMVVTLGALSPPSAIAVSSWQVLLSARSPAAPESDGRALPPKPSVAFVVSCEFSHEGADDPIVHPGHRGASHRHSFFGNKSTNADSTVDTLRAETKTTCDNTADQAAYWAPSPTGDSWTQMRAYYDAGPSGTNRSEIVSYPLGLTMIAGFGTTGPGDVAWSCNRSVGARGWSPLPPKSCANKQPVAVRIGFPQCWDGKRLRADGGAHLAHRQRNACPSTHSKMLPRLQLVFTLSDSTPPKSLSVGALDRMHADFFNVWQELELEALIDLCVRGNRATSNDLRRCRTQAGEPAPL